MRNLALALTALAFLFASVRANPSQEIKSMNVKRVTPVLLVKEIEPIVPFWVDRLGFTKTIEVPDGNKLGFVAFQKGTAEVMYQTYASPSAPPSTVCANSASRIPAATSSPSPNPSPRPSTDPQSSQGRTPL